MIFDLFGGDKKRVAEMIAAARSGDTEKIEQLLSKGADINAAEPESGDTPLLAAVDKSQWAAAELLLKHHPDLSLQDKNGNSALYLTVSQGDSALLMVNQLLQAGASPDLGPPEGDNAGATPLHIACATGANGCLASLLRHGASSTKLLPSGASPMHTATIKGDQTTIELLSNAGGDVNALSNEKRTPLHNCGITGNANVAAALIRLGAEVDPKDKEACTPLMHAVMKDHTKVAKVLLDSQADPNVIIHTDSTTLFPLYVAAMHGQDEMISNLIDKGANVAAKVDGLPSLADVAKHSGHESAAKLLAAALKRHRAGARTAKAGKAVEKLWQDFVLALNGAKIDEIRQLTSASNFSKLSPDQQLIVQSMFGATDKVRMLLSAGANPNISFGGVFFGAPVLYVSAGREGSTDVVALLLDAGADPHLTQKDGSTALHVAAKRGNVRIAKLLMEKGVDPNSTYVSGVPPLIDACIQGNTRMVDALIDGGANINAAIELGFCAFAAAIDNKRMNLAEHLLERGASPSFGDVDTLPLAVAEHGSMSLIRAIESRGGSIIRPDMLARVAFVAARNKDWEVLDHVLSSGADLGHNNDLRYSQLILASLANHTALVGRYLARGDDANLQDVDRETALSLAIEKDHREVIDILRRHSAQVIDYPGLSPMDEMLRAATDGALGTILNLYDAGISINIEDAAGNSPLMMAAQSGHVGVVRGLYHLGADINHKNRDGLSASNLAKKANQEKVLKTLMEFGADDATQDVYGFSSNEDSQGSRRTIDMGDAVMGRYSHPFKDKLPYDEQEDSNEAGEVINESEDEDVEAKAEEAGPLVSEEIAEMLNQLENLLGLPHIIEKVSEEDREVITARIKLVWANGENALPSTQLEELVKLCELFASQPETEEPPPPLFEAASEGDLQHFRKLIKAGADIKETLPDGTTLLMTATENGHNDIVQELIELGVDVNQRKQDTFSAFLIACFLGHDEVVKTLAKHGADVNAAYEIGSSQGTSGNQTALTVAAARGNCPMCALLLKFGADLNIVSDSGYTPLMWSLANGSSEDAAELLLKAGANPDPDAESKIAISASTTPLILASTNGLTAIVKALIKRNVAVDNTDGNGWTALKHVSDNGHDEIITLLLKAGASPNIVDREGWTALINAAGKGHVEVCKKLLKAGADVNAIGAGGRTPLLQAIGARSDSKAMDALKELRRMLKGQNDNEDGGEESQLDLIKILLKAGANPNVLHVGKSLLSEAMENDDEELVKLLKKHGAAVSIDPSGVTANSVTNDPINEGGLLLLAAAAAAHPQSIKELVDSGVNVNVRGSDRETPLSVLFAGLFNPENSRARFRNKMQCIDFLITRGARAGDDDPLPLVTSAMHHELHFVSALLHSGVDVNKEVAPGQTALFMSLLAPDPGHPVDDRCALALLKAGADSSLRHESGAMPIHLAAASNYLGALQELLERRPQDVDARTNIGITPLMMAATEGHAEAAKLLLKFGADPGIKDQEGLTAREVAIKNGNDEVVQILN